MAMRNFYIEADIEGRKTMLTGGPAAKDGGMTVDIRQREEGNSVLAFRIECREYAGKLTTKVYDSTGHYVAEFKTKR